MENEQLVSDRAVCKVWGDPHVKTFASDESIDFVACGEFLMAKFEPTKQIGGCFRNDNGGDGEITFVQSVAHQCGDLLVIVQADLLKTFTEDGGPTIRFYRKHLGELIPLGSMVPDNVTNTFNANCGKIDVHEDNPKFKTVDCKCELNDVKLHVLFRNSIVENHEVINVKIRAPVGMAGEVEGMCDEVPVIAASNLNECRNVTSSSNEKNSTPRCTPMVRGVSSHFTKTEDFNIISSAALIDSTISPCNCPAAQLNLHSRTDALSNL